MKKLGILFLGLIVIMSCSKESESAEDLSKKAAQQAVYVEVGSYTYACLWNPVPDSPCGIEDLSKIRIFVNVSTWINSSYFFPLYGRIAGSNDPYEFLGYPVCKTSNPKTLYYEIDAFGGLNEYHISYGGTPSVGVPNQMTFSCI